MDAETINTLIQVGVFLLVTFVIKRYVDTEDKKQRYTTGMDIAKMGVLFAEDFIETFYPDMEKPRKGIEKLKKAVQYIIEESKKEGIYITEEKAEQYARAKFQESPLAKD